MNEVYTLKVAADPQTPEFIRFLAENWLNLIFGIIGALGTTYGFMSWKSSQKEKRSYK